MEHKEKVRAGDVWVGVETVGLDGIAKGESVEWGENLSLSLEEHHLICTRGRISCSRDGDGTKVVRGSKDPVEAQKQRKRMLQTEGGDCVNNVKCCREVKMKRESVHQI